MHSLQKQAVFMLFRLTSPKQGTVTSQGNILVATQCPHATYIKMTMQFFCDSKYCWFAKCQIISCYYQE